MTDHAKPDIVKRLRNPDLDMRRSWLMQEAADEIERLRKEIGKLQFDLEKYADRIVALRSTKVDPRESKYVGSRMAEGWKD